MSSSRPKLSDLYTPSHNKLVENHTLHSGTYLYSPYVAVLPRPQYTSQFISQEKVHQYIQFSKLHKKYYTLWTSDEKLLAVNHRQD